MGLKKEAAEKGLEVATDLVKNNATNVLGMLFPYAGLKKKAVEMRMEQIEKSNLPDETKLALILNMKDDLKRIKNQKAVAEIAVNEAKEGTDFSEKSGVNEEWFERYMDAAKFVNSEEMQLIWGKILAGDFEKPGSTPPNMIRVLSEITPELAQAFRIICSMKVSVCPKKSEQSEEVIIVPYSVNEKKFLDIGLKFELLSELDTLGVVKFDSLAGFTTNDWGKGMYNICICDEIYEVQNNNELFFPMGDVMLTKAGIALQQIVEPIDINDYCGMVQRYFTKNGLSFYLKKGQKITL